MNNSIATGLAVGRFIESGRHTALADPTLDRVVRLWKAISRIAIVVAVLYIGLFAVLLVR
ncbi:MAG TPA: hypothetical protein VIL18_13180 [Longimicrobiales bacterium]